MIKAQDAIAKARELLGTPYSQMDCIGLIVYIIRHCSGGNLSYKCQGTNWLWRSITNSSKYRDLTWRQEGITGALAGMLAFKRSGDDVHHIGIVTGNGTVIHSSSAKGCVVETPLDSSWKLLGIHKLISTADSTQSASEAEEITMATLYTGTVHASPNLRIRDKAKTGNIIGHVDDGDTVEVLAESDGWLRIRYGETVGYVSGDYVTRTSAPQSEPAAEESETTSLRRSDGVYITLAGRWTLADD